jgi:hypothetical protein
MLAGKKRNGRPVAQGDQIFGWGIEFTLLLAQLTTKIFCRKPFSLKLFISQDPNFFPISIKTVPEQKLDCQISVRK